MNQPGIKVEQQCLDAALEVPSKFHADELVQRGAVEALAHLRWRCGLAKVRQMSVKRDGVIMWSFFKPKPKSATLGFVEGALTLRGKIAQEIALATDMASTLTGGTLPPLALARHAQALRRGPVSYRNADLGVSTALFFFRERKFHDVLDEHQIAARLTVLELLKSRQVNPMVASAFEASLYDQFAPHRRAQFVGCAMARWPELREALQKIDASSSCPFDIDDLLRDEKVSALIVSEFKEAANQTRTTPAHLYLDRVAERLIRSMFERNKSFAPDEGFEEAVRGVASVILGVCLGVAPAILLATGIPHQRSVAMVLARLDTAPWDKTKRGKYWWGATHLVKWALHHLETLAGESEKPDNPQMRAMQNDLQKVFAKGGIDFSALHPVIRRAILNEAMRFGSAEFALASFKRLLETAEQIKKDGLDPAEFVLEAHRAKLDIHGR